MKKFTLITLGIITVLFLNSLALSAQVKEENSIEPGRKYPPMSISSISANNGINMDAPAGSIAVAENTVYNAYTASQLVQNVLITGCITATNVRFGYYVKSGSSWNWTNHSWSATAGDRQMAYFNKASSTFPLTEGIVLTTGKASSAMGPNNTGSKSDQMVSTASDPDLASITGKTMYDAAVLEFDFVPSGNTVEFTYVFSSEEYLEYCETQYNDAFGFFLSGPAISGSYTNNSVNLATIPGNIPVSVNTIHPAGTNINNAAFAAENAQYYVDYPANTTTMQYDGSTVVLTATYTVSPCSTYRIRMAVADASDQRWDAGVFLGARSFNSENLNLVNFGNFIEGQNNVFEGCNNKFRIQRTNPDISQPITLSLILSGTFTNGVDIQTTGNQPFPTQVTIPANTSFIDIPYTAISDGISDNGETLIIKTASSCPCAATVVYVTQTINIYEQVVINSISATNAQCNNQSNGTIVANVSGGSGSYLFSINGGTTWQSLNSFSGLAAGTYTVTIQEPGSCHANISGNATIGNPSPIVANAGTDVSICAGGSAQLAGGGGVIYSWTPTTGLNFSNIANPIASPSVTTEYTLTTTSASGQCASTENVIVTVLPLAVAPASVSVNRQIVCNDDNGNIILTATGGSGTTLEWFAGSCGSSVIGTGNNLSIASPAQSTHYFARWTNGCGSSACAEVTVSVPTAITASISSGNIACNGGSTVITVTASGGTGALQYSLNGGTYQSASTFTVNGTGSPYTVTVKDANNCSLITNTLAVTGPSAIAFGSSSVTNVSCTGGNNGQIIISATGGTGTINYSIVPNTGTQTPSGTFNNLTAQSYTVTAQDQNGCTKNTIVIVGTVPDITPPTLVTCPPNQSANANSNCQAVVPDYTALISATDNCTLVVNLSITQIPAAGTLVSTGITPVIITVKDAANNSVVCNTTFTVTDATAPVILTCAPAVTASANTNCQAVVPDFTSHITATDNCTSVSSLVITQSPIAGTLVATGVTTVTITVTDATGHTANCSATFTVTDSQNPTISGPGNITVNADPGKCYASSVSLGSPVTSDNCGIASVSNNAPAQFPVGSTTVIWTATDLSGLTAISTQIVTVIDNQPPTIICPPTVMVNAIIGQTYATGIILGSAITNDNCGVASVTNNAPVQFPVGSTTVTWTVTDVNGHTATCTQTVIVIDTQAPVLVCPSAITVNCGSEIPAAYSTLSEYIAAGGTVTTNDEINASSFALLSQTSNGQTCPETITRVYTIADVSNNHGTCSQQIIIQDITAPVIAALPATSTINCPAAPEFAVASAVDACGSAFTLTSSDVTTPGACAGSYSVTRTWTATDACGNISNASQTINVQDITAPVIAALPAATTINCPATPEFAVATAIDACGSSFTLTSSDVTTPGDCAGSYSVTRTWTATDACGNISHASQTINVQDITAPVIAALPAATTINCPATPEFAVATAVDACGSAFTLTSSDVTTPGACAGSYSVTRTWTATDACGNISYASQTINVQDITAPVIAALPAATTINCPATPEFAVATAVDACSSAFTLTSSDNTMPGDCAGSYSVTRTWTATDACGNISHASQTINVQDVTAPVVTCSGNITVNTDPGVCGANIVVPQPAIIENCGNVTITNSVNGTANASGFYQVGTTAINWTVKDACGNTATCSMNVTVIDTELPVITCPSDILICSTEQLILGVATATDNCAVATITSNAPSSFSTGTTLVLWTATDIHGNISTCTQSVTINPIAIVNAGPDDLICAGQTYQVNNATVLNYSTLQWTSNGQGTIQNGTTLHPLYIPVNGETGNVLLTLTAMGISPCASVQDQMLLTILPTPVAIAGPDATICEGQSYTTVNAFAGYTGSVMWTSNGTGTFTSPNQVVTTYNPSAADVANGSVMLTLTSAGTAPCGNASSTLTLTINAAGTANAGIDASICNNSPYQINDATAQNFISLTWTHNGLGILTGSNTLTPTYTPAAGESGVINLILTAVGNEPCGNSSDIKLLTINNVPAVSAGVDLENCDAAPIILTSATASYAANVLWTSTGTGTFINPEIVNATYIPSQTDVQNGSVVLTLTVTGNQPCGTKSDQVTVTLIPQAIVFAGESSSVCSNTPFMVSDATVSGATSVSWTHDGTGTLENAGTINPTYIPAAGESGLIHLFVNAEGQMPCGMATDSLSLQIITAASVNAGNDIASCLSAPVMLEDAHASDYTSLAWSTSGSGTFNDATILTPIYSPSQEDFINGFVDISIQANGVTPCGNATDILRINFIKAPTATAGPDVVMCSVTPYTLTAATAGNFTTVSWTHNGHGILSDPTVLNPTYTPADGEKTVEFKLTAYGSSACSNMLISDIFILTINPAIVVNAGIDEAIATGTSTTLNGNVSGGSGIFSYNWSPEASLVNNTVLNPNTLALTSETIFKLTTLDMISGCFESDEVKISMGGIQRPIAVDDSDTIGLNATTLENVLANDSDPLGLGLDVSILHLPLHGTASVDEEGMITYTPFSNFTGNDTLTYVICDHGTPSKCDTAMLIITIFPIREYLEIYNLVTPNGDGKNDFWYIRGIDEYSDNELLIFNRWGDKIREFKSYNNTDNSWNGSNEKNERLPDGVYYYILKIKDLNTYTGWVYVRGQGNN